MYRLDLLVLRCFRVYRPLRYCRQMKKQRWSGTSYWHPKAAFYSHFARAFEVQNSQDENETGNAYPTHVCGHSDEMLLLLLPTNRSNRERLAMHAHVATTMDETMHIQRMI